MMVLLDDKMRRQDVRKAAMATHGPCVTVAAFLTSSGMS